MAFLVKGFTLSCRNKETIVFTIDLWYGNLIYTIRNKNPVYQGSDPLSFEG